MNRIVIIFFLSLIAQINTFSQTNVSLKNYEFSSYPAFHNGFYITLNRNNKTITLIEEKSIGVLSLDSINEDGWGAKSVETNKINSLLPKKFIITKEIGDKDLNTIIGKLDTLYSLRVKRLKKKEIRKKDYYNKKDSYGVEYIFIDEDEFEDGIRFNLMTDKNIESIDLGDVTCGSKDAKIIIMLYNLVGDVFENTYPILNILDDSRQYITCNSFYVKSFSPLYIRLYDDIDINDLKKSISELPNHDEIVIDISHNNSIKGRKVYNELNNYIKRKYKKIIWVTTSGFWIDD